MSKSWFNWGHSLRRSLYFVLHFFIWHCSSGETPLVSLSCCSCEFSCTVEICSKMTVKHECFFFLLFCFLSLCSLMKNFKYATGFLFPSVFSPRLLSSVWPCQWYYESVSNIMTQVKSSFFSSLRPLIFSPEQVCSSCVIVGFKCGTFAQVVKSQNKTWKDPQWFHD